MSCRLLAAHRICSGASCAGVARLTTRVPLHPLTRTRRLVAPCGGVSGVRCAWSIAAPISTATSDWQPQLEETVVQEETDKVEDDIQDIQDHYESVIEESANDDCEFRRLLEHSGTVENVRSEWKPFLTTGNFDDTLDERIIDVLDSIESIVSFEPDENSPEVPIAVYWNKLSHLLAFAYRSDNARAGHALDVYRYRARESLTEASTTKNLDKTTTVAILTGCLANSARDTLAVLSGPCYIPWAVRADCCYHLRQIPLRWNEISKDPKLQGLYRRQIDRIKSREEWLKLARTRRYVKARHLDLMLEGLPPSEALKLATDWQGIFPVMPDDDILYLVEFYTKLEDVDSALKLLRRVSPERFKKPPQPNDRLIGRCVKLLKLDVVNVDGDSHSFRILPVLLELGLPPLDIIHELAIQNAAKSGLIGVSMDLYRALVARKVSMDDTAYTATALLKQSYIHKDTAAMNELMTMIQAQGRLLHSPYVLSTMINIIRHICYYERKASPEECLSYVLAIYDRVANRNVLARIGIIDHDQIDGGDPTLPAPHPMVLANTIWAYVLTRTHEESVRELWFRIVRLLERDDRQIKRAVDVAGVFRAFLIFYQRSPLTLSSMVEVLEYVLSRSPDRVEEMDWMIVINGFLRHGEDKSARHVRQMMQNLGRKFSSKGLKAVLDRWPHSRNVMTVVKDIEAGMVPGTHSPTPA